MRFRRDWLVPLGGAFLVLLHHAAWYRTFPQYSVYPPDQAGYLAGGRAIFSGLHSLARSGFTAPVVEELRRWFDFFGVGVLYGLIDALKPGDLGFVRATFACFNALTAVGVWSLARRLGSSRAAVLALVFFVVSPAFPSGASRLYADPVTGCLIVWAVRLFVERGRMAVAAGALAGVAMLIRVQLLPWVPLGLAACSMAALLLRVAPESRALIRRGWLGLSVPLLIFAGLTYFGLENRNDSAPKHNLPRYHYYAYGFWQYLESDGWEGPWRLKKDPFYAALVQESRNQPGLLSSRPRQYVFAARYVSTRLDAAIPIVLGNFYRIFDRPQNPEHRGFIDPRAAIWIHRLALLCAIVAATHLYAAGSPGFVAPLLILSLGGFHALAWGWPRYAMPVLPVLLALAGLGLDLVIVSLRERWRAWLSTVVAVGVLLVGAAWIRDRLPELAWVLAAAALLVALVRFVRLPFGGAEGRSARIAGRLFAVGLSAVVFGNAWRDKNWHEGDLSLQRGDVVRQEIQISPPDLALLRSSHDHLVAVDLELRDPGSAPWPARVNGLDTALEPSMPPLPESIPVAEEGRAYPQWWLAPLTDAMLDRVERDGALVVELTIDDPDRARLKADRFRDQETVFEAPSLGDWPYAAGIKPEYDRDFRLVRRMPLTSRGTRTRIVRSGATVALPQVARIRAIELDDREGSVSFEMKRAGAGARRSSPATRTLLGFAARAIMRNRGHAAISVSGQRLAGFEIAPFEKTVWTEGAVGLCYQDRTPDRSQAYESRGLYLLAGPLPCATPSCRMEVKFWPGMDDRPMGFSLEPLRSQPGIDALQQAAVDCGFDGPVEWVFDRLIDGTRNSYPEDRGRWRVARIY